VIPPRVASFIAAVKVQEGLPYIWPSLKNCYSGKGHLASLYPEGRDCSGLISASLRAAGDTVDRRAEWSANRYWHELPHTSAPEPGDFAVFGYGDTATHIEVVMEDGRTFGANGGNSSMNTPTDAREAKAFVRYRRVPRKDLLGHVVNPLR
jgi:cell wall-associated NlpC family hydrolase